MAACIDNRLEIEEVHFADSGLVTRHAYSILAAVEVVDNTGKQVRLVKLRNPWGKFEWKGDWG